MTEEQKEPVTEGEETKPTEVDAGEVETSEAPEASEQDQQTDAEVNVKTPEFQNFGPAGGAKIQSDIGRFQDVKVSVSAELGRTKVPIQQLLELGEGSVLELNRSISSPVELIAQGVPLANGEVVVVDDCFAIRIKEIYPTSNG